MTFQLSGSANKPIIFLYHSLGGIVVKRALYYAQTRTGYTDHAIFTYTYNILFFGTPHNGISKATWLVYLKRAGAAATLGTASRRSDLVAALEHESETLQNVTDFFVPLASRFWIFYFWETRKTYLGWTPLFTLTLGKAVFIVPHTSAVPPHDNDAERAGIVADHRGMVRFETPDDQGFQLVVDALGRYCFDAVKDGAVGVGMGMGMGMDDAAAERKGERVDEGINGEVVKGEVVEGRETRGVVEEVETKDGGVGVGSGDNDGNPGDKKGQNGQNHDEIGRGNENVNKNGWNDSKINAVVTVDGSPSGKADDEELEEWSGRTETFVSVDSTERRRVGSSWWGLN
ncbi:uncharacterized protein C8A04DRAFT_12909 [Dichotomopilus funicola]|uniref:DUF676 domain-containing protein n=1 Tax=Dichotomopilus funicola TaxID=1934379 RepID=A0AAN6V3B6_9PEZI|nr:hypothetical protein C8A04DRAFT_12909 [Dichotomopilus funicola]